VKKYLYLSCHLIARTTINSVVRSKIEWNHGLDLKIENMIRKNITPFLLVFAAVFGIAFSASAQSSQPFFTETFPSRADFNANWTSGGDNEGPEEWEWLNDPSGLFNGQPDFASETASNGFVRFNSDANVDPPSDPDDEPVPFPHDVTLTINNPIDCSGRDMVFLSVQNQYGYFSNISEAQIGISTNGVNFDYITVLEDVAGNDISDPVQIVEIDISEFAANEAQVFIQFRWIGSFEYTWSIDDIKLFDEDPQLQFDLALETPLLPFNYATPLSQAGEFFFGHAYRNNGSQAAMDVMTTLNIEGNNGDTLSTTEALQMTFQPSAADTVGYTETFMPSDTGVYTFNYLLSSANDDERPSDNTYAGDFLVTENLFSKDDGRGLAATQPMTIVDNTWEIGNYYVIENAGQVATDAIFSVASTGDVHQGQDVSILLYQITDNGDTQFDDDDVSVVGFGSYSFTDEPGGQAVSAPLLNFEGDTAVALEEGAEYLLMVQYTPDMAVVYTGLPYFYDVATVVKNGDWFLGGFGSEVTALVRMRVADEDDVTSIKEPALADNKVQIFPNPVDRELTVQIALDAVSTEVQVEVMDVNGRLIRQQQLDQVQQDQVRINTSQLSEGTYMVRVRTAEGVRTERFVVQH